MTREKYFFKRTIHLLSKSDIQDNSDSINFSNKTSTKKFFFKYLDEKDYEQAIKCYSHESKIFSFFKKHSENTRKIFQKRKRKLILTQKIATKGKGYFLDQSFTFNRENLIVHSQLKPVELRTSPESCENILPNRSNFVYYVKDCLLRNNHINEIWLNPARLDYILVDLEAHQGTFTGWNLVEVLEEKFRNLSKEHIMEIVYAKLLQYLIVFDSIEIINNNDPLLTSSQD